MVGLWYFCHSLLCSRSECDTGGGYDSTAGIIESALSYSPTVKAERDPTTGKWMEDSKQALLNHPLSYLDIEDETKTKRFLATAFTNFYFIKDVFC